MRRFAIALCVLALGGCADLAAVRDISTRLSTASSSWNDVGNDLAGSCEREAVLNPVVDECESSILASKGVVAANAVLGDYFKALTAAATETNFSVQPGLDKATTAVEAIPNIDQGKVKAVSGLVGLLVKLAAEKMREDTLRQLIGDGGPAAQEVVDGMRLVVASRLRSRLDSERTNLTGYFLSAIARQGNAIAPKPEAICVGSTASTFSATGFLLAQEYCRRLAVVDKRQKALADYDASLVTASKALVELQSSKTRLKAKALAQKLYAIGSDLDQKVTAVRKAFA